MEYSQFVVQHKIENALVLSCDNSHDSGIKLHYCLSLSARVKV